MTASATGGGRAPEELVANYRDLGGLGTICRRVIRPRLLLRSSALTAISPRSMDLLTETLGTCRYFDLRTDREVERDGGADALVARGWQWIRIPVQDEDDEQSPPLVRHLRTLPQYQEAARRVLQEMSRATQARQPAVVACSLGKDRTGIVVALILKWLGVPTSDIAADFVLSNRRLVDQRHLLPLRWRDPQQHTFNLVAPDECLRVIEAVEGDFYPTESRHDWLESSK
jgi:protein-tyrosine phosphatase